MTIKNIPSQSTSKTNKKKTVLFSEIELNLQDLTATQNQSLEK